MTGANDWTLEIETKGLPDLKRLYQLLGAEGLVSARTFPQFGHNYNSVSRTVMYEWFNRHLGLGFPEPVQRLLHSGFAVAGLDLLLQGELREHKMGAVLGSVRTRMVCYADCSRIWHQAGVYTFGYNPALFAHRVHDVLTLIVYLDDFYRGEVRVSLVGLGEWAGPLGAGGGLWLAGEGSEAPLLVQNAYEALNRAAHLTVHPQKGTVAAAIDWLLATGSPP